MSEDEGMTVAIAKIADVKGFEPGCSSPDATMLEGISPEGKSMSKGGILKESLSMTFSR
jgi:hypothetical protein